MSENIVLAGNLEFLEIADLLQFLGSAGSTGIINITSKHAQNPGYIYIQKGNPVNASCGSLKGLDALYSFFGWSQGLFKFSEEKVTQNKLIKKSRMEIILDGLRKFDEGKIEKIGHGQLKKQLPNKKEDTSKIPIIKGPLVDYMYVVDEEDFKAGDLIVHEGMHGSWFWVILDGIVEITKNTDKGQLEILRLGNGAFLGSLSALQIQGNIRSATVKAVTDVQLGVIDSQLLFTEYTAKPKELKSIIMSLDKRLKQITQRAVDSIVSENTKPLDLANLKIIMKKDATNENVYMLAHGTAYVVRSTKQGLTPFFELKVGDYFGHIPFLDIGFEPYAASVLATDDFKVEKIDITALHEEYNKFSSTMKNIIENIINSILVTTKIATGGYYGRR